VKLPVIYVVSFSGFMRPVVKTSLVEPTTEPCDRENIFLTEGPVIAIDSPDIVNVMHVDLG
jgi:hypothetical protein